MHIHKCRLLPFIHGRYGRGYLLSEFGKHPGIRRLQFFTVLREWHRLFLTSRNGISANAHKHRHGQAGCRYLLESAHLLISFLVQDLFS